MGLTRADLIDPRVSDKDKAEIAIVLDRYMQNDVLVNKTFKDVGILVTSHPNNRAYLKSCIESHLKLNYWITLAYDNYIDPKLQEIDYNKILPAKDVIDNIDTFIMPHHQVWGGVMFPYFWLLKFGINAMQDFKYIYCVNGDCILEKPENFNKLLDLLGDADIMSCGPSDDKLFSTAGFISKYSVLKNIIMHFEKYFIPFENYEKYTQEFGNTESRFRRAIDELNFKEVMVKPPYNEQQHVKGFGTWYDIVGFRHIHAEHNYAYRNKKIPPEIKYFDVRFMGDEYKKIESYWHTKETKILEDWWPRE